MAQDKARLAGILVDHADQRGWVDIDTEKIKSLVGESNHDVTKDLYDFRRSGWMRFQEHKVGSDTRLTSLRLTSSGRRQMALAAAAAEEATTTLATPAVETGTIEGETPYGVDTSFVADAPASDGTTMGAIEFDEVAPEPTPVNEPYPIIRALVLRTTRMEAAADLLTNAGQDDLALAVLEKLGQAYSPLEAEAVLLWHEWEDLLKNGQQGPITEAVETTVEAQREVVRAARLLLAHLATPSRGINATRRITIRKADYEALQAAIDGLR